MSSAREDAEVPILTFAEAIREALAEEMRRDSTIVMFGEDIESAYVFGVTKGLVEEFGSARVRDTPMSELAIIGVGVGAALTGSRPVPEIQFVDFMALAMDQLVNQAAKIRYMTGGQAKVPMVVRSPVGHLGNYAAQHSQSFHAWFCHTPGLQVVMPSTAADAKGLLKTALRNDSPVVFLEHKKLYQVKGEVPEGDLTIPFGQADIKRVGSDVTVVATGWLVIQAMEAAERFAARGVSVEVVDPRTLVPLDRAAIVASVKKTGRLVVADQAPRTCGFAAEISALAAEECLEYLNASVRRVTLPDVPMPFAKPMEDFVIPTADTIERAIQAVL
jgi:pyruvate dehydrogenase E1 component beta subunit